MDTPRPDPDDNDNDDGDGAGGQLTPTDDLMDDVRDDLPDHLRAELRHQLDQYANLAAYIEREHGDDDPDATNSG